MDIHHLSLLVVDQLSMMRSSLCYELETAGFTALHQARDSTEALAILNSQKIDIVISELAASTGGLVLLKAMRHDEKWANTPFIMFTDIPDRESAQQTMALGINDFLIKPFTAKRLHERIEKIVQNPLPARKALSEQETPAALAVAAAKPTLDKSTILIVDDTPDNIEILSDLFKEQYKIKIATGGEKALSICMSDKAPDLILLDVMMPDMDGFEVARRLREHHASAHIPIIFISAVAEEDARKKGLSLGAIDYVSKPIDPHLLNLRINNLMAFVDHRKQIQNNFDTLRELESLRQQVKDLNNQLVTENN